MTDRRSMLAFAKLVDRKAQGWDMIGIKRTQTHRAELEFINEVLKVLEEPEPLTEADINLFTVLVHNPYDSAQIESMKQMYTHFLNEAKSYMPRYKEDRPLKYNQHMTMQATVCMREAAILKLELQRIGEWPS